MLAFFVSSGGFLGLFKTFSVINTIYSTFFVAEQPPG